MSDRDRLHNLHNLILGKTPSDSHAHFYSAFPKARGYSNSAHLLTLFDASLVVALYQVMGPKESRKVYFLVPAPAERWVTEAFKGKAQEFFSRLKAKGSVPLVRRFGDVFSQIMLGSQAFALPQEPERWVAFGFAKTDPIPTWMGSKLLDLPAEDTLSPGV